MARRRSGAREMRRLMARSRTTRAFAILVLVLAQVALGLSSGLLGGPVALAQEATLSATHAVAGSMAMTHRAAAAAPAHPMNHAGCHHGAPGRGGSMPRCPSCPDMPGGPMGAGCPAMAGCAASPASPSSPASATLATVALADVPRAGFLPPARDFVPESPPPRA